jgi:tRNA/rRNA methyltransferase
VTLPPVAEFDRLRVVLVGTRNPLNVGAAARAMSNFGFLHLRVVKPYEAAFREARSAVGASQVLTSAEEYKSVGEAVADCGLVVGTTAIRHRELQHPLKRLEAGARLIRTALGSGRVAILFGSEKVGLSNLDLSHCHWLLRIPTRAEHISMNLGQAVAVCLYELVRDVPTLRAFDPAQGKLRRAKGWATHARSAKQDLATAGEVERITGVLLEALRASGYLKPRSTALAEAKVRRLLRRMKMEADDAEVWLGMLRQILWEIRSGDAPSRR